MLSAKPRPPALLPIHSKREVLLYTVETFPVIIVVAAAGAGKSTQIPQFLYRHGWTRHGKQVVISQPDRSSVIGSALHVADQVNCQVGQEVGYSIRWRNMTSETTKIKFISDDLLLREIQVDPLLQQYSVVVIDDAHLRTLSTDILLALLARIVHVRPDLRIVICSATVEALSFAEFFDKPSVSAGSNNAKADGKVRVKCIHLEESLHQVDIQRRQEPVEDYLRFAVDTVFEIISSEGPGDVLVFLTGKAEVYEAIGAMQTRVLDMGADAPELRFHAIHLGLGRDEQSSLFQPPPENTRRVFVSTDFAEAGITLDGISFVIDCGLTKLKAYDFKSSVDYMAQTAISKLAAVQRARHASLNGPGKCFQGYTASAFESFTSFTPPEIKRSRFTSAMLLMKNLGIANPLKFDYLERPPADAIANAIEYLLAIGAIGEDVKLSKPLGTRLADMPLNPRMSKALLTAPQYGCTKEMLIIAAMTDAQMSPWASDEDIESLESKKRLFGVRESDHLTLLNIFLAFKDPQIGRSNRGWCEKNGLNYATLAFADKIHAQLQRHLEEKLRINVNQSLLSATMSGGGDEKDKVGKTLRRCLLSGYFEHAAKRQSDGFYQMVRGGRIVHMHKGSFASKYVNEWIIFGSTLEHEFKGTEILDISRIERDWLPEEAPSFYRLSAPKDH